MLRNEMSAQNFENLQQISGDVQVKQENEYTNQGTSRQ